MREDYLRECLSEVSAKAKKAVPMDELQREFCSYCQNRECARSGASNMAFDRRTLNWNEDLFVNVQRAPDGDPAAERIRSIWTPANFVVVTSSQAQEPEQVNLFSTTAAAEPAAEPPADAAAPAAVAVPEPARPAPAPRPVRPVQNTPFDAPAYAGPAPEKEKVMSPGDTFTFGDD
jgi:hypothetical protein